MTALKSANLALAFVLELCVLAALASGVTPPGRRTATYRNRFMHLAARHRHRRVGGVGRAAMEAAVDGRRSA